MQMIATYALVILACAVLNYAAGRKEWIPFGLSFRPLFAIAPAFAGLCFAVLPWMTALAFAAAFVLWRGPSWGHVYQLGNVVPTDRPPPWHERLCMKCAGGNVYGAALIRHSYLLPPLLAMSIWPALALPFLIVGAYALANRVGHPVVLAEPITGALWGALIVVAGL